MATIPRFKSASYGTKQSANIYILQYFSVSLQVMRLHVRKKNSRELESALNGEGDGEEGGLSQECVET